VNYSLCQANGIPVLRRSSGGGTVLQGPGCLNYALVLDSETRPGLENISQTNRTIMQMHRGVLTTLQFTDVQVLGHTDLAIGSLKCSGNAQRRKGRSLIFHGTFLLDLDLSLVEQLLPLPGRQPSYRENRPHRDFLKNLKLPGAQLKEALRKKWQADEPFDQVPWSSISALVKERYSSDDWNLKY
jgi:lipoate-protein ligase A